MQGLSFLLCLVLPAIVLCNSRSSESNESQRSVDQPQQWYQPQMKVVKKVQFVHQRPEQTYRETEVRKVMKKIQRNNGDAWNGVWMIAVPQQQRFEDAEQSWKKINEDEKAAFHSAVMAAASNEDSWLNATDLLKKYQYPAEEVSVKTDDGYYLTLIHIPTQQSNKKNQAVFLMHGLLGSADDWLVMGPGKSLAYQLSDAGYDVYLGNARGNKYSRRHTNKHPATSDFWQFSNDDIALHDLPALIDAALETSQQKQLYYIGYSQGATGLLALLATQPQYNDKIKMMFAVAPVAYMAHAQSPFIRTLADKYESISMRGEFQPQLQALYNAGGQICENAIGCRKVCSNPLFAIAGVNGEQVEPSNVPVILGHADTTSTRVMKQLAQWMVARDFRRFDYGADLNEQVYGQRVPPSYEMSAVRVPVAIYHGEHDLLAHPDDVRTLQQQLPVVYDAYKVPEEYFSHTDYVFSKNAPELINKRIINTMKIN